MAATILGAPKHTCALLAVLSQTIYTDDDDVKHHHEHVSHSASSFPFPTLVSSGRLEVQTLNSPTTYEFCKSVDSFQPNFIYLQGQRLPNNQIGSLLCGGVDLSTPQAVSQLFNVSKLPTTVYLEVPNGEELAEALHSKGIPYVIYWKNTFLHYAACHFRQALFSVVQSSSSHTWDAFNLAHASFSLYCARNNLVLPDTSQETNGNLGPHLIGEPPKIDVAPVEMVEGDDEEGSPGALPAIKIYDDDVNIRFLICGMTCTLDECLLGSLADGLNALLSIEMRGSKLHSRVSALPPPLQAGTFSRGVVTMRCDLSTSSSAHISLLVSGSAQTCFDDQLLENHIKSELIEKNQLVHALPITEDNKQSLSEPRTSAAVACGRSVFEVGMKVPTWALQVLRQLAPETSYRCLVALGIAGVQGLAVASFEEDDAERILFFCRKQGRDDYAKAINASSPPIWLRPPAPSRKRSLMSKEGSLNGYCAGGQAAQEQEDQKDKETGLPNGIATPLVPVWNKFKVAAMRPIPHIRHQKMLPFAGLSETNGHDGGQVKANLPPVPSAKHSMVGANSTSHRKSLSSSYQAKQIISLNPLPLKKHGCERSPIHVCSEEEFLKDVMQFLILRGHTRLIPQGGIAEFPDAILNAKRLDLFNLYREVVSRGGFHVGNGINWKGQVFSKMSNHTVTNRMTGVGNTLKRHYETYLLEYELAHDDVDGECCLLCHSSAAGDWVNCGICGEWAHFGCDRRQGLGAFKDYAKTDGLEYICPQCSISNFKKKLQKPQMATPRLSF